MIDFTRADLPAELRIRPLESFDAMRERFSHWLGELRAALDAMPRVQTRDVPFIGGQTDLSVAVDFKPLAVMLGGVRFANSGAAVGTGVTIDWAASDGGYQLRSVAGLTADTAYILTLVAMGVD